MKIFKQNFIQKAFLLSFLTIFVGSDLLSAPLNNPTDPQPIYVPTGLDKFYTKRPGKAYFGISLSPFYLHSGSAKDKDYIKKPAGDIKGQWDMFGVFLSMPKTAKDEIVSSATSAHYPKLQAAKTAIYGINPSGGGNATYTALTNVLKTELKDNIQTPPTPFDPDLYKYNLESTKINYEKIGLRGQLNFEIGKNIGACIKGGVADYRQAPSFNYQTTFIEDVTKATPDPGAKSIYNGFLSPKERYDIFAELGFSPNTIRTTVLEDTFAQLYWQIPFELKDKGDTVVTVVPNLAIGAWLPTCQKRNTNQLFTLSGGNDGHTGLSGEFELSFDFPGTVQASVGAGIVGYNTKDLNSYPVPTHKYQSGFYPWKANIQRKPGVTWSLNVSMKAPEFIKGLSAYFDYVYTQHERDTIKFISSEYNATENKNLFLTSQLEDESDWTSQIYNFGMDYRITKNLVFGAAFQSNLTGKRVYRPTTILGSMKFEF